jgi:uncharacterized protein DUF1559
MRCRSSAAIGFALALAAFNPGGPARGDEDAAVAAARNDAVNQLKQLGLALLNHHDTFKKFPPPAIMSKNGKPLLSWRVKILPFLEQKELYKQFHLDEAWDSPHNKDLIAKMPGVYSCTGSNVGADYRTVYQLPRGATTAFPGPVGTDIRSIRDGTSNTIAIVETDDEHAVIWTRPDDWKFDPEKPGTGLGGHFPLTFYVGALDASVHALPDSIDTETLRALFTSDGKERVAFPDR